MTPEQQKALDALLELAHTPMELSLADWGRICSAIRAAIEREFVTVPVIEDLTPDVVANLKDDYWTGNMASYEYDAFWKAAKWMSENAGKAVAGTLVNGWQPIESAPHGIWVLIFAYGNVCQACWNSNGYWSTFRENRIQPIAATHWMPLPAAPKVGV